MSRSVANVSKRINVGGLAIAIFGFLLTRFTVTLAVDGDPVQFFLVGLVPLVLGLAVTTFGVVLAVGAFEPAYARTVALWSVVGTSLMAGLVALTLYGSPQESLGSLSAVHTKVYLSNFLIGGCFGGTLTGVYAARNRRERLEQEGQAKRMMVLNRVLRDAVLNSITAIHGHLDLLAEDEGERERAIGVIDEQATALEETVREIKHLTANSRSSGGYVEAVDAAGCVRQCAERARERFPHAEIYVEDVPTDLDVWADEMIEHVLELLVENAIEHNDAETPRVALALRREGDVATVSVRDDGPGLPADQKAMLEHGTVSDFDDPFSGFGLNVVSLLVDNYRGEIVADVDEAGTWIGVQLSVVGEGTRIPGSDPVGVQRQGVSRPRLGLAGVAGLAAGLLMAGAMEAMTGVLPVIGALYSGAPDPVVGILTHEFHSVVFGIVFVAVLAVVPERYSDTYTGRMTVGLAWGLVLWVVAAGIVMPLWLDLVGMAAPSVPNLSFTSLVGHVVWGVSLGGIYSLAEDAVARVRSGNRMPELSAWAGRGD